MLKGVKQLWPSSAAPSTAQPTRENASPAISPSGSYFAGGPADQATPRASNQPNPFDAPPPQDPGLTSGSPAPTLSKATSALSLYGPGSPAGGPNGIRTPTSHGFGPIGTPGAAQPTTAVTVGDTLDGVSGMGFGLHEPPKLLKTTPGGARTPQGDGSSTPVNESADAQVGGGSSGSIRGTLNVKLIQARGLNVQPNTDAQPYVVMQFEQNEFVSRTPHAVSTPAAVPFTQSQPQPLGRTASAGGLGSITRAFADAMGRKRPEPSGAQTPKAEETQQPSWLGRPGPGDPIWKEEVTFDLTQPSSVLLLSVYDRNKAGEGFLGMLQIKPVLKDGYTLDQWYKLGVRGNEAVSGEVWIQITFTAIRNKIHLKPSDFEFLKLIGRGTFGRVFQVRKKDTKRIYAMKVLSKKEIVAKKEVAHTIGERKILQRSLECPFLVGLKFSFQTEKELYFVTDYKCGGELFWHLQKEGRFSEDRARFYIAELVLALEHLHKYNIVYRDLKPENILLDATGHIALCDFGLSKPDLTNDQLTNTFCGTTEYLAPEVLLDEKGYGKHVDFWSLGVLLFEMCCGWSPFYAEQTQEMYRLICYGKIRFPKHVIGDDGKQFVKGLLNRNPQNRLGAKRGAAELKEHPFFKSIDWDLLYKKQITPPFKPIVDSDESVANFDPEFTNSSLADAGIDINDADYNPQARHQFVGPGGSLSKPSYMGQAAGMAIKPQRSPNQPINGSPLTSSVQENFRGFTYTGESLMPMSLLGEHSMEDVDEDNENAVDDDDDEYSDEDDMEGQRTRRQSDVDME
ncbi:Serine/threonine-protein kinase [Vanrija albida]|uniref:Serine/threonine-protein kinase n=1 Tax=Vanrija albida TaxID=181172 RepID=A0ABR3PTS5_9TREE